MTSRPTDEIPAGGFACLGEPLPVEFANTLYVEDGVVEDLLATPAAFVSWQALVDSPCRVPDIRVSDLADVLVLRDATHAALSRLADDEPIGAAALDVVNAALARAPMSVTTAVRANGIALEYAACSGGADGLVATLALHVGQLLASADRESIRKCARPACPLLFVQYHRRRRFCHHRCSNAERQRLHRQRQQQRSTP